MYSNSMFSLYLGMNGNQGLKLCLADMCKNLLLVVYVVILCLGCSKLTLGSKLNFVICLITLKEICSLDHICSENY